MQNKLWRTITIILTLLIGIGIGIFLNKNKSMWSFLKPESGSFIKFDDTREITWNEDFQIVEINSSIDNKIQQAYYYPTKSEESQPLIVSLHTWSGDFKQTDELAEMCRHRDVNYIHPNFRGANKTISACCSELALADIDDAISFAIESSQVDTSRIYVIGVSGGGYATISSFMKLKHRVKAFSAWASITDLPAWYHESKIRQNKYAGDILNCTEPGEELNLKIAKEKSPIYWPTPTDKLNDTKLSIHAGIYDGIQGSVPITHSINFYNKVLKDLSVTDSSKYVSSKEKLKLLEFREPLGDFGSIAGRKICLKKEVGNFSLTIFEGNHEMLTEYALNEILNQ